MNTASSGSATSTERTPKIEADVYEGSEPSRAKPTSKTTKRRKAAISDSQTASPSQGKTTSDGTPDIARPDGSGIVQDSGHGSLDGSQSTTGSASSVTNDDAVKNAAEVGVELTENFKHVKARRQKTQYSEEKKALKSSSAVISQRAPRKRTATDLVRKSEAVTGQIKAGISVSQVRKT